MVIYAVAMYSASIFASLTRSESIVYPNSPEFIIFTFAVVLFSSFVHQALDYGSRPTIDFTHKKAFTGITDIQEENDNLVYILSEKKYSRALPTSQTLSLPLTHIKNKGGGMAMPGNKHLKAKRGRLVDERVRAADNGYSHAAAERGCDRVKGRLELFFEGRALVPFLALLVFVGHATGLELYLGTVFTILGCFGLYVCRSIKFFIPFLLTFIYQLSLQHTPGMPTWSDYYKSPYRTIWLACLAGLILVSLIFYTVKNIIPRVKGESAPLFYPLVFLSLTFILNGAFSPAWTPATLIFGLCEALIYFYLFYLFYYGLEGEDADSVLDYISYVAIFITLIIVGELAILYLREGKNLLVGSGYIFSYYICLGWGINNPVGYSIAVMIPLLFRGAIKSRYYPVYFISAVVAWVGVIMTLSRNAMIWATLTLGFGILIGCIYGKRKKFFRSSLSVICVIGFFSLMIFYNKLHDLFRGIIMKGFSDNGRFVLWEQAIENFKRSPIFGTGFFGFGKSDVELAADFLPTMAHNTIAELLSAMGIVGFIAYGYYRLKSFVPLVTRPSFNKLIIGMTLGITVLSSMLDNFDFYFYTMYPYMILLAILHRMRRLELIDKQKLRIAALDRKIAKIDKKIRAIDQRRY